MYEKSDTRKIIFLDFDGVLIYGNKYEGFNEDKLILLGKILEKTEAEIIVSSSWRSDLRKTKELLRDTDNALTGGTAFPYISHIKGVTPRLTHFDKYGEPDGPARRGEEIEAFLQNNPCYQYVVLDDSDQMLPKQRKHWILVDDKIGLSETDAIRCIEILNSQENN